MPMIPQKESYSDSDSLMNDGSGISRKSRYSGVMITCWGSRLPAVNSISSTRLSFQL